MSNILNDIDTSLNIKNEALLVNLDKTLNILTRVFVKNINVFLKLYYNQNKTIYDKFNKFTFSKMDAGDIYNNFIMSYPETKNITNEALINDKDFKQICFVFSELVKNKEFNAIKILTEEYRDDSFIVMWECCKYFIVPLRINMDTMERDMKENILRKWLSVVFVLPFHNEFTNRYNNTYPQYIVSLQKLYGILVKDRDGSLSYTDAKDKVEKLDNRIIDSFIGPISSSNNFTESAFRLIITLCLYSSIDIIKKFCPNIKQCKMINPNYDGSWISGFDVLVNEQIKKINAIISNVSPK